MTTQQINSFNFQLRMCEDEDINSVISINERTLPENYPLFFYKQILERYQNAFILAYEEDNPENIIGYTMWRTERGPSTFKLGQVKKGHLVSLAVLPEYRRRGVASGLLRKSMEYVDGYDVEEFVLEVRVSNIGAVRLYSETFNYETIKIISHYYRDGEDAFYMCENNNPSTDYIKGSKSMNEEDIISYYDERKKTYLCYRCPNCKSLLIKSLSFALMGSINPNDSGLINCPYCDEDISLYAISVGKFDIK